MIYSAQEADGSVSFWFGYDAVADPNRVWLCATTAEQAPEVERLLRAGQRLEQAQAEVLWTPADVQLLAQQRGFEVTDEWATAYLAEHAHTIQAVMTERGWDALAQFMPTADPAAALVTA